MKNHATKHPFLQKIFLFIVLILNVVTNAELQTSTAPPMNGLFSSEFDLERSKIPKNILLGVNLGGWSHQRYIVTVANILADRGYNITLAARGTFPQSSQFPKIKFFSLGELQTKNATKDEAFQKAAYEKYDPVTIRPMILERFYRDFEEVFLKFKEIAEIVKPDLFFCDAIHNDMCLDVAMLKKKPKVLIATSLFEAVHIPYKSDPIFFFGCKVNMENESFWERFRCEILSPIKFTWTFKPPGDYLEKRAKYGLPIFKNTFERLKNTLLLVDNFAGLEVPMPLPPLCQEIGPVLPDYFPPLTPELEEFIASHKRTMFVALGSFLFLSPENNAILLQSIVESIKNNIIDGVIWGNIRENQENFPSAITLSNGKVVSTSDIFDNRDPNIYIASYAPQFAILNHTNTKIFLSHSGPGSLHESLLTGTPILALPISFDQPGFADRVVSAGAALPLDKFDLRVDDILNKIEQIQRDEQIQINVKRLQALAIINSKRKYRAADLIEYTLYSSIMKQKDVNDDDRIENWVFKEWITPAYRMGFIRGNYLDVYVAALGIAASILIGTLWIIFVISRPVIKNLFGFDKVKED